VHDYTNPYQDHVAHGVSCGNMMAGIIIDQLNRNGQTVLFSDGSHLHGEGIFHEDFIFYTRHAVTA